MTNTDVLLVSMPFCNEYMPCMTYAMFKSILTEAGIKSSVQHEYLYYATWIGKENYRRISNVCTIGFGHDYFACETVFAEAAHGKTLRSFDEYVSWMKETHLPGKVFAGDQQKETLETLALFKRAQNTASEYLEEAAQRIMKKRPKIVAFISMFQQHNATIALAKRLKKEKDAPLILAGGPNCHGDGGSALIEHVDAFDYVFTGEGDSIFTDVCRRLLVDGKIPDSELPAGVVSRTKLRTEPAELTKNLDKLPVPDFSDFYRERSLLFPEIKEYVLTVEGSRGCWWASHKPCRFCALNGKAAHVYREKSVVRFADEIEDLAVKYPGAQCFLTDNVLSLAHQHHLPDELLKREAYRKNRLRLFCEIKSTLSEEELVHLVKAGFFWVQAGIETFSDSILKLMGKGVSAIRQVQIMKHCLAHGVRLMWYILVGTPGETEQMCGEANAVIPKIMHFQAPGTVAHVMFLRDSYYTEHPGGAVPELRPDMGYDFVYPDRDFIKRTALLFSPKDPGKLACYYDYRKIGPAYEKLYTLTETWRNTPQFLLLKDKGEMVKILDTRLIAHQTFYHLTGVKAQLCRSCRNVMEESALIHELSGRFTKAEVLEALAWLVDENLLLKIGSEYLTLAVDRDAYKENR